jgi:hypothetical protein
MSRRTRARLCAAIVTASAAAGLLAGPVGTASAASEAYNRSSAWLIRPSNPVGADHCVSRKIWLAAGTYRWRVFGQHWAGTTPPAWSDARTIWLRAGTYTWRDCLDPAPPPPVYYWGYDHTSTLNVGSGPAVLHEYAIASYGNGTYNYGSALLRTGN